MSTVMPRLFVAVAALLLCFAGSGGALANGTPGARILFLGNSITLHSPAPEIGWTGNWGMAASAPENDYVHLIAAGLAHLTGAVPEIRVRNIADFERGFETFDIGAVLKPELEFAADTVVIAIGENVAEPAGAAEGAKFEAAFTRLLAAVRQHGNPAVFVRSSFWPSAVKDGIMRKASAAAGVTFVDISALGQDATLVARAERKIEHGGVAGHPGDKGMKAIAGALLAAIAPAVKPAVKVVLNGAVTTELAPHAGGNVYAPEIHRDGPRWLMWYGGQGSDGHDRIHLAESATGVQWTKRGVVIDCGTANHVNDPSVVRVEGVWWMFYTVAGTHEMDEIAAATSPDGVQWEKRGVVLPRGTPGRWDSLKVGRPAVLHEGGVFRLWFDGQPAPEAADQGGLAAEVRREGRAVGYAESPDGLTWTRRDAPVFRHGAGAVHVTRAGSRLVMLIESGSGVNWADSPDGFTWQARGRLLPLSGGEADRFGQVTPFLLKGDTGFRLYFGAASRSTWDGNTIAFAPVLLPE